jgi:uncharacterized protein YndB with AHSA1/START domain
VGWILGVLVGLAIVVAIIGSFLPKDHEVTRTLETRKSPELVWEAISDFESQPDWWHDLKDVSRMPDQNGNDVWKETTQDGMSITLETVAAEPPVRLVRRIADEDLPFSGEWEYHITPTASGSSLTITERGSVSNPIFRFVNRVFMDQAATIEGFLRALADRFQENPKIS